jgi:hypothetical protein
VTETHETVSATVDVYLTIVSSDAGGDRLCRIEFQTLTEDYDRFRPLIRRIVSSVRPITPAAPPASLFRRQLNIQLSWQPSLLAESSEGRKRPRGPHLRRRSGVPPIGRMHLSVACPVNDWRCA